ncbi:MAG: T9SS type A sorting domain-containing protein, partial [Flavobacteriia bacterium]
FITSILFLGPVFGFAQNNWIIRDSVKGSPRAVCANFTLFGQGYVLGGLDDFGFKRKVYSYDLNQDDWDEETSIGGPNGDGLDRGSASAFSIGNKGYLCLGQGETNPYFGDLWEFDGETGAWSQKADFMGSDRRQAVAFSIGNFGYVGTGQDASGLKKDFYKYDPLTNSWIQLNDFGGTARRQAVGFTSGEQGYVGTGDDGVLKNDFWMYEPTTDSWIQKTNLPSAPRAGAVGWGFFPSGYIATGEDATNTYRNDVWEYNYFSNSWIQRTDLLGPGRKNAIAFQLEGIAFLGTGYNGEFLDDFYAYYCIAGIDEQSIKLESRAYPNPVINKTTVSLWQNGIEEMEVRLYNSAGQLISSFSKTLLSSKTLELDLSGLNSGNYFYELIDEKRNLSASGKLIKIQ